MGRRSFTSSDFSGAELVSDEEDFDPMSGLGNLSDAMLVFACGLMLALILLWNIDVNDTSVSSGATDMEEIEEIQAASPTNGGEGYKEMGTVYQDPETGEYWMFSHTDD